MKNHPFGAAQNYPAYKEVFPLLGGGDEDKITLFIHGLIRIDSKRIQYPFEEQSGKSTILLLKYSKC